MISRAVRRWLSDQDGNAAEWVKPHAWEQLEEGRPVLVRWPATWKAGVVSKRSERQKPKGSLVDREPFIDVELLSGSMIEVTNLMALMVYDPKRRAA